MKVALETRAAVPLTEDRGDHRGFADKTIVFGTAFSYRPPLANT